MTREERKRTSELEKVIDIYGSGSVSSIFAKIISLLIVIVDAVLFIRFFRKDELFNIGGILYFNALLLMLACAAHPCFAQQIGDTGRWARSWDNAVLSLGGAVHIGKFLCTLPFNAKDVLNLRLAIFEKNLCLQTVLAVALQIAMLIAGSMGFRTYDNVFGMTAVIYLIADVLILLACLSRISPYQIMIYGALCGFTGAFMGKTMPDAAEEAAELESSLNFLNVFSGVSGIVIIIVFAAVLVAAGEFYLKRKNSVSWHMY